MYTEAEIQKILESAIRADLNAPSEFFKSSLKELQVICNGVGADWMPAKMRKAFDKLFPSAMGTVAIHDFMYSQSDGSTAKQKQADDYFLLNGIREADGNYPWYNWKRYFASLKVHLAYRLLQSGGRRAWLESFYINSKNLKWLESYYSDLQKQFQYPQN